MLHEKEFEEKVKGILDPALKSFFVLLYYTGRKPLSVLDLRKGDFELIEGALRIRFMQDGAPLFILLPTNHKLIIGVHAFVFSSCEDVLFNFDYRKHKRIVSYMNRQGVNVSKEYLTPVGHLNYLTNKLFGFEPEYFRKNRVKLLEANEVSDMDVYFLTGILAPKCVRMYLRASRLGHDLSFLRKAFRDKGNDMLSQEML